MESDAKPSLSIVVQVGFAGSRRLLNLADHPEVNEAEYMAGVESWLVERLQRLREELGLSDQHFLCGISQMAIGADMVFSRACRTRKIPHRVFLPQPREEFLNARGTSGIPDFSETEKQAARDLMAGDHVIQERVVSDAADRHDRFTDVNVELARVSDVLVCLVSPGTAGQPGGTVGVIDRAAARFKPVLVVTVDVRGGRPAISDEWQWNVRPVHAHDEGDSFARARAEYEGPQAATQLGQSKAAWSPPMLPSALAKPSNRGKPASDADEFLSQLREDARGLANVGSTFFKVAATVIISTHVAATVCAVLALRFHLPLLLGWLLAAEVLLLAVGLSFHQHLHYTRAAHEWAVGRLAAEVRRSVAAARGTRVHLEYLFSLPFPDEFRSLLRTANVLHLKRARDKSVGDWRVLRDGYLASRLVGDPAAGPKKAARVHWWWPFAPKKKPGAQFPYYVLESRVAVLQLKWARALFLGCSALAITATVFKLMLLRGCADDVVAVLGAFAIVLPVLAVGVLSLAAALDLEARRHTFHEMADFLDAQVPRLQHAASDREFAGLLLETESRLLGETVNWFSRRAYTDVA